MKLEERWQIAVAMFVSPTINLGRLISFNPSTNHPIGIQTYTRSMLHHELKEIHVIVNDYNTYSKQFDEDIIKGGNVPLVMDAVPSEDEIYQAYLIKQSIINPT